MRSPMSKPSRLWTPIAPTFVYFPMDTVLECGDALPVNLPVSSTTWPWQRTTAGPLDITWADTLVTGACQGTDTLFRTFTAIDACGNTTTQVQTLFHIDTTAPTGHRCHEHTGTGDHPMHGRPAYGRSDGGRRPARTCRCCWCRPTPQAAKGSAPVASK